MHDYIWTPVYDNDDMETQECTCPHCGLKIAGVIHCRIEYEHFTRQTEQVYYILECPSCGRPLIYQINGARTLPSGFALRNVKHLPQLIGAVYEEVNAAIGAGCYTAAVGLARTALNHIAVDKGAEENKNFTYYVKYLVDSGFVPPNAGAWVDKIRQMANDSVHHLEIRNKDEAVTIGTFLMYILIFVYELPASVE